MFDFYNEIININIKARNKDTFVMKWSPNSVKIIIAIITTVTVTAMIIIMKFSTDWSQMLGCAAEAHLGISKIPQLASSSLPYSD